MSILSRWAVSFVRRPSHSLWLPSHVSFRPYTIEANESAPRKGGRRLTRIISTLTPSRLKSSDLLDISTSRTIAVIFPLSHSASGDRFELVYAYRSTEMSLSRRIPFPANTRGFLYFHLGHQSAALSGSIRFRLTPDDSPSSFARGDDLVGPSGFPWSILLAQVACRRSYGWIADQLVHENLVTQKQLSRCRDVFGQTGRTFPEYTLFHLDSMFLVNFSRRVTLTVVGEQLYELRQESLFLVRRSTSYFPWSGSAIARFEPSTLPEHSGRRVLHMRIVKIVEPVACTVDAATYDGRILRPEEGQLFSVITSRGSRKPWTYDIDNTNPTSQVSTALRTLWDISPPS
ncbi:hypothetical protein FB451DRAFT_1507970 [Mycena latifolia]|nr:hypothetical protein FB451DRAFT_1507970 [Mycena latifolia]